ncbi:MAG: hypothetical protein ACK559_06385, partial [bacterium]
MTRRAPHGPRTQSPPDGIRRSGGSSPSGAGLECFVAGRRDSKTAADSGTFHDSSSVRVTSVRSSLSLVLPPRGRNP